MSTGVAAVVVQLLSYVWLFVTPWTAAHQASLSFTTSQRLLKLMSIEPVMTSNHLTLCHALLFLPSIFPSIRVFSNELALHIRWPKYWSFSFSISHSNEYWWLILTGLISFSPRDSQEPSPAPEFKSINSSALRCFYVQLSHPYMTTGETIALIIQTFVGKVMSFLFNMLSSSLICLS